MMQNFKSLVLISAFAALISGCQQQQKIGPSPDQTLLGPGGLQGNTPYYTQNAGDSSSYTSSSGQIVYDDGSSYNPYGNSDTVSPGGIYEGSTAPYFDTQYSEVQSGDQLTQRDTALLNSVNGANGGAGDLLQSIYFGYDEYSIRQSERAKLAETLRFLQSNPGAKVIAEGHTDWRGTNEYNLGLGDRRANSVKSFLVGLGANGNNVAILSKGELDAVQDVAKGSSQATNDRRVDILVVR